MDGQSLSILGGFIATWSWIAVLTWRLGTQKGVLSSMKEKIDLIFAKVFNDTNDDEIMKLKERLKELEKKVKT